MVDPISEEVAGRPAGTTTGLPTGRDAVRACSAKEPAGMGLSVASSVVVFTWRTSWCGPEMGVGVDRLPTAPGAGGRVAPGAVGTVYVGGAEADPVAGAVAPTGRQIAHIGPVTQQVSGKTL